MRKASISFVFAAMITSMVFADACVKGERVALFDGKTLKGWTVLKCQAEVRDGQLLIKSGNGLVQTEKEYGDFILEFECKALKSDTWDSGVYFRYDKVPANRPWPGRYQVNLRKGMEGNVGGVKGATSKGLYKAGQWNTFKLTVEGTELALEMNGKPAWKATGLAGPKEGFISVQAEVPHGGQFLFRNIYITTTTFSTEKRAASGKDGPWPLFNGKDLTGWHVDVPLRNKKPDVKPTFIVRDGKLVSLGRPNGHLITDAQYANYRLEVEYRFAGKPGNCGVLVHASKPRALYKMFPKSIEVQMNHRHAGDFWCIVENITVPDMVKRRGPKEKWGITEGKARRILNLTDGSEKPVGQWNSMVVECVKDAVKVWVNGDLVNHGTKCTATEGRIALQAEGSEVEFRKLLLTPIKKLTDCPDDSRQRHQSDGNSRLGHHSPAIGLGLLLLPEPPKRLAEIVRPHHVADMTVVPVEARKNLRARRESALLVAARPGVWEDRRFPPRGPAEPRASGPRKGMQ